MAATLSLTFFAVMAVSAFAIPLAFVWWVRNTPRYGREPMRVVIHTFFWGAIVSVVLALLIEFIATPAAMEIAPLYNYLQTHFAMQPADVFGFLIAAPFIEEGAKGLAARSARLSFHTPTDGLVYGAAAGLGFSATENLLYGLTAWLTLSQQGLDPTASLAVIVFRSFSSSLLHGSATAVTGYGVAKAWLSRRQFAYLPFYFMAVVMHAAFNFTVNLGSLYPGTLGGLIDYVGFFAAIGFAVAAITIIRFKLVARRPAPAR